MSLKNVVYVTGHKNPDSDSICAAILYAELKNKIAKYTSCSSKIRKS